MSCPAAMHGVSRDVICFLSQMDVLFSPGGEIAALPVPPDVWYAAVCALEFVTVTPPGPWPSRESATAAAAAATTISTTGSRWSSSRFAPRNSQPHEPGEEFPYCYGVERDTSCDRAILGRPHRGLFSVVKRQRQTPTAGSSASLTKGRRAPAGEWRPVRQRGRRSRWGSSGLGR